MFAKIWNWIKGEPVLIALVSTEIASLAALIPAGANPLVTGAVAIVEAFVAGLARNNVTPVVSLPGTGAPAQAGGGGS